MVDAIGIEPMLAPWHPKNLAIFTDGQERQLIYEIKFENSYTRTNERPTFASKPSQPINSKNKSAL